jgi:uncharacterized membrane protein HdeD (DUF308 family)
MASGVVGILIGLLVRAHPPSSVGWAIGLLVGVDLLLACVASIEAGPEGRRLARLAH